KRGSAGAWRDRLAGGGLLRLPGHFRAAMGHRPGNRCGHPGRQCRLLDRPARRAASRRTVRTPRGTHARQNRGVRCLLPTPRRQDGLSLPIRHRIASPGRGALARRFGGPLFAFVVAKLPASLARRELAFAAASLGFVAVFTKIAEDVITKESTAFDHGASLTLHAFANPVLDRLMHVVSDIGSAPVVSAIVGAVIVWCLLRKEARVAAALAGTALATEGLNLVLKLAFQRTRPSLWELATLHSYSFPSGHAMAALAIYGMVAVIVARRWPRLRW